MKPHRSSVTLSDLWPRFQGHDITQRQITRKQYKIELYLQWPTIESRIWFIERRHFQWPWTTTNPFWRSRHSFTLDISQAAKDTAIVTRYYKMRIGNRTQAFEWYQFEWPRVTSNPDFKVPVLFNTNNSKTVQDRAIFDLLLPSLKLCLRQDKYCR